MNQRGPGSVKGSARIPTASAAGGFHGHGLSFDAVPTSIDSDIEILKQENEQLREQLQHHQHMLSIWQQQPCTICQLSSNRNNNSTTPGAVKSIRNDCSGTSVPTSGVGNRATSSSSSRNSLAGSRSASDVGARLQDLHAPLDKAFRQQQVLIAQLQRQVMVLQVELSSRNQLVMEADTVLAETSRRLASVAALATETHALGGSAAHRSAQAQHDRRHAATGPMARDSKATGRSSSGGGIRSATASPAALVAVAEQILEQVQDAAAWCSGTAARIDRVRAESAAQCRAARTSCNSGLSQSNSGRSWDCGAGDNEASSLQQLQLQYLPAGGTKFLRQSGSSLSLPAIALGQGLSLLHVPALHSLSLKLISMVQPLADLAVQLRTIVLPVLPWLVAGPVGQQLPGSCAALAQTAANAAADVVELCSVLPGVAGSLSKPATAAVREGRLQQVTAVQGADSWGSKTSSTWDSGEVQGELASMPLRMCQQQRASDNLEFCPEEQQLFDHLSQCLERLAAQQQDKGSTLSSHSSSRHTGQPASSSSGRQLKHSTAEQHAQLLPQQAQVLLRQLRQQWTLLQFKRRTLEQQLGFVAKCSAEQAKLVSALVQQVAARVASAADGYETEHGLQQRRDAALRAVKQVQRAALLLQQQRTGEAGSSALLRSLAGILEQQVEALDDLPELLLGSSANVIKGAALAAVADAFEAFRSELQSSRQVCSSAVPRGNAHGSER